MTSKLRSIHAFHINMNMGVNNLMCDFSIDSKRFLLGCIQFYSVDTELVISCVSFINSISKRERPAVGPA